MGNKFSYLCILNYTVAVKSNAVSLAFNEATAAAQKTNHLPVPKHLCNAPDKLSKKLGLGQGYRFLLFSLETLQLFNLGNYWGAGLNIALNLLLSLLAAGLGAFLVKVF